MFGILNKDPKPAIDSQTKGRGNQENPKQSQGYRNRKARNQDNRVIN